MASSGRRDLCGSETQRRASESMAGSDALLNINFTGDYHAKHVPCGSVCRFCQRSDEAANPIQHANPARKGQPTLPWRRQHGQECAICPWAINDSETYSALSRQKIADDNKNPEKRAIFMTECVDPYENKKSSEWWQESCRGNKPQSGNESHCKDLQLDGIQQELRNSLASQAL